MYESVTTWVSISSQLADIIKRLTRIETLLKSQFTKLSTEEAAMAVDVAALTAEVERNTSVTGSVVQVVNNLVDALNKIPPSSDPVTQAALDDLKAKLAANDDAIAAAVTAGTR